MEQEMANICISRALKHEISGTVTVDLEPGAKVLRWRENVISNRIGEWIGPYTESKYDFKRKLVWLKDYTKNPFSITHVKNHYPSEKSADTFIKTVQKG